MGYWQDLRKNRTRTPIIDFLREDKPYSSMRLLQFIFFILFSFAWFYVSLVSKPPVLADVPPGVQMVIGILLTGKVLQKGVEAWKENDGKDKNKEDKEKEKEDKDGGK